MPNFANGKIYKLVSPSGLTYVGSTTQSLAVRKGGHRRAHRSYQNGVNKDKVTSFSLFDEDADNIDIVLIEKYPCVDKEELHQRERFFIENTQCVNKYLPITTPEEKKQVRLKNEKKRKQKFHDEMQDVFNRMNGV
ncbi:hypothetical protein [Clostridium sp.]|uniref:hypothetical protein n=1 Tax=Clostridium sp. TaxID=1506 RepID=UPI00284BA38F|nr:hypothetical protein [Clostridium sp.]MDR3597025.1 hypothetical protein [Clostridium sp.]